MNKFVTFVKKTILIGLIIAAFSMVVILSIDYHVRQAGSVYILDSMEDLPEVDAVIVLGAYVFPDGRPSVILQDRLDIGYMVFQTDRTNRIIVSGDNGRTDYDEVNGMRMYLQSKGIDRESIFMDHAGFNTYDTMYRARDIFLVERAAIVTQEYHLMRAVYIARQLGIEAYGIRSDKREYLNADFYNLREVGARLKAFLQVNILKSKPKFLGDPIPVWEHGSLTDDGKS